MPRGSTFYRSPARPSLDAPEPRVRIGAGPPAAAERHGRTEGTNGEIATTDTNAIIFTASGLPDLWVFTARTNGALVVLEDILGREDDAITVLASEPVSVRLPRRRVSARSLVGGAAAALSVQAYYAKPGEPLEAPA